MSSDLVTLATDFWAALGRRDFDAVGAFMAPDGHYIDVPVIGIEDGVDGMVHKSDLSWTQRINNPAELYRKGDEVQAIILSVNDEEKKVNPFADGELDD